MVFGYEIVPVPIPAPTPPPPLLPEVGVAVGVGVGVGSPNNPNELKPDISVVALLFVVSKVVV